MRRRSVLMAAGVAAVVIATAGPAFAKVDLRRVIVDGPGLETPIVLAQQDAWDFISGGGAGLTPPRIVAPPRELGPTYEVTMVEGTPRHDWHLKLYPFAEGGPILHLGNAKMMMYLIEWGDRPGRTGWVRVAKRQIRMLTDRGFPEEPPAAEQSPVASSPVAATTAAARESGRPPIAVWVALGSVAAAGALVIRRRFRRTAKPAT